MHIVFVYGTLKRGYGNNRLITAAGGEFLGEALTIDAMYLCGGDGIPFACRSAPTARQALPIRGEVFRVNDSGRDRLDQLENHPTGYRRSPIRVLLIGDDRPIDAEIYIRERAKEYAAACRIKNGAYEWGRDDHGNW